jgi:hypothetical protein
MKLLFEGFVAPAVVSVVVAIALVRGFRGATPRRLAASLALAVSFFAGFAVLETGALRPSTYWHYLPWLALVAGVVGPIGHSAGIRSVQRLALMLLLTVAASWFLVPTWASLQPFRDRYVAAFAGALFLYWFALDPLARRAPRGWLPGALALAALNGGVIVAAFVSIRLGLLGVVAGAALSGSCVAAYLEGDSGTLRGMLPAHVVVFGGVMLAAGLNVGLPPAALILICSAPFGLWLCCTGPLARLPGKWRSVVQAGVICLPLVVAWGLTLSAQQAEQTW